MVANRDTPEQISGFPMVGRNEPVGSELLRLSGKMAVGGEIEPSIQRNRETQKTVSLRRFLALAKRLGPPV
jgi:hypothetical protein